MKSMDKYTGSNCIKLYPQQQYTASSLRFSDKENNAAERLMFSNYWREQIDMFGQKALYYRNSYNTLSADNVYGEHTTAKFQDPQPVIMLVKLAENALILSKFGYQSDEQCTAYMHISSFYAVYPPDAEPKAGDVFQLTEYGSDRPGERNGRLYEITERVDQDNSEMNPLMGHYVWRLQAKRFDFSFEPNITPEKGSNQVHDDTRYGTTDTNISGDTTYSMRPSSYPGDANTASITQVFDMSVNNTEIYGGYY